MSVMMWVWFGITVALLIVEVLTTDLVAVWFSASSLIMGIVVAFFPKIHIIWQIVIFVVLSTGLLCATRPLVKKLQKRGKNTETNLELIINHTAVVVDDICNSDDRGAIKINGLVWSARSTNGDNISKDTKVIVEKINGNKALVKQIFDKENK